MMKLEYILLIAIALGFYETSIKEWIKDSKNKEFIENNLEVGSKIVSETGIIGEVIEINNSSIVILTGNNDNISSLNLEKSEIKSIVD